MRNVFVLCFSREAAKAQLGLFGGSGGGSRGSSSKPTSAPKPRPAAAPAAQLGLFSAPPPRPEPASTGPAPGATASAETPHSTVPARAPAASTGASGPPQLGLFGALPLQPAAKPADHTAAGAAQDPSHGGALHREQRTDATGRTQTRWVGSPRPSQGKGSRLRHKVEAGEHVFGSRADLAARSVSDLERLSAAEARKAVTKARLLPDFDAEAFRTQGKSPGYITLRHAVERLVAAQPPDSHEARVEYMKGLDFLTRSLDACTTAQDVSELLQDWHFLARGYRAGRAFETYAQARDERSRDSYLATAPFQPKPGAERSREFVRDKDLPSQVRENPYAKMAAMLGPSFARAISSQNVSEKYSGKTYANAVWMGRDLDREGWNEKTERLVEEATGKKATRTRAEVDDADKPVAWGDWTKEREAAGRAERVGGRALGMTSSHQMVAEFGLKNVQFGNWVNDDDAREHVRNATGAFHDLADVLGIEPRVVSLKGRLSLGIGARGHGGMARAHYEPSTKAINLTRWAGGGSLAHEWGHALDNLMAELHRGGTAGAAGWVSDYTVAGNARQFGEMPATVREAFEDVMGAIYGPRWATRSKLTRLWRDYQLAEAQHGRFSAEAKAKAKELEEAQKTKTSGGYSRFYRDSDAFNGKSARGGDPEKKEGYWTRPHELFARAFETYVEQRLKKSGRRNTYLVRDHDQPHPTGRFRDDEAKKKGEHAWPYPLGEERDQIHAAFDRLFDLLRATGAIYKALDALDAREGAVMGRHVIALCFRGEAGKGGTIAGRPGLHLDPQKHRWVSDFPQSDDVDEVAEHMDKAPVGAKVRVHDVTSPHQGVWEHHGSGQWEREGAQYGAWFNPGANAVDSYTLSEHGAEVHDEQSVKTGS